MSSVLFLLTSNLLPLHLPFTQLYQMAYKSVGKELTLIVTTSGIFIIERLSHFQLESKTLVAVSLKKIASWSRL